MVDVRMDDTQNVERRHMDRLTPAEAKTNSGRMPRRPRRERTYGQPTRRFQGLRNPEEENQEKLKEAIAAARDELNLSDDTRKLYDRLEKLDRTIRVLDLLSTDPALPDVKKKTGLTAEEEEALAARDDLSTEQREKEREFLRKATPEQAQAYRKLTQLNRDLRNLKEVQLRTAVIEAGDEFRVRKAQVPPGPAEGTKIELNDLPWSRALLAQHKAELKLSAARKKELRDVESQTYGVAGDFERRTRSIAQKLLAVVEARRKRVEDWKNYHEEVVEALETGSRVPVFVPSGEETPEEAAKRKQAEKQEEERVKELKRLTKARGAGFIRKSNLQQDIVTKLASDGIVFHAVEDPPRFSEDGKNYCGNPIDGVAYYAIVSSERQTTNFWVTLKEIQHQADDVFVSQGKDPRKEAAPITAAVVYDYIQRLERHRTDVMFYRSRPERVIRVRQKGKKTGGLGGLPTELLPEGKPARTGPLGSAPDPTTAFVLTETRGFVTKVDLLRDPSLGDDDRSYLITLVTEEPRRKINYEYVLSKVQVEAEEEAEAAARLELAPGEKLYSGVKRFLDKWVVIEHQPGSNQVIRIEFAKDQGKLGPSRPLLDSLLGEKLKPTASDEAILALQTAIDRDFVLEDLLIEPRNPYVTPGGPTPFTRLEGVRNLTFTLGNHGSEAIFGGTLKKPIADMLGFQYIVYTKDRYVLFISVSEKGTIIKVEAKEEGLPVALRETIPSLLKQGLKAAYLPRRVEPKKAEVPAAKPTGLVATRSKIPTRKNAGTKGTENAIYLRAFKKDPIYLRNLDRFQPYKSRFYRLRDISKASSEDEEEIRKDLALEKIQAEYGLLTALIVESSRSGTLLRSLGLSPQVVHDFIVSGGVQVDGQVEDNPNFNPFAVDNFEGKKRFASGRVRFGLEAKAQSPFFSWVPYRLPITETPEGIQATSPVCLSREDQLLYREIGKLRQAISKLNSAYGGVQALFRRLSERPSTLTKQDLVRAVKSMSFGVAGIIRWWNNIALRAANGDEIALRAGQKMIDIGLDPQNPSSPMHTIFTQLQTSDDFRGLVATTEWMTEDLIRVSDDPEVQRKRRRALKLLLATRRAKLLKKGYEVVVVDEGNGVIAYRIPPERLKGDVTDEKSYDAFMNDLRSIKMPAPPPSAPVGMAATPEEMELLLEDEEAAQNSMIGSAYARPGATAVLYFDEVAAGEGMAPVYDPRLREQVLGAYSSDTRDALKSRKRFHPLDDVYAFVQSSMSPTSRSSAEDLRTQVTDDGLLVMMKAKESYTPDPSHLGSVQGPVRDGRKLIGAQLRGLEAAQKFSSVMGKYGLGGELVALHAYEPDDKKPNERPCRVCGLPPRTHSGGFSVDHNFVRRCKHCQASEMMHHAFEPLRRSPAVCRICNEPRSAHVPEAAEHAFESESGNRCSHPKCGLPEWAHDPTYAFAGHGYEPLGEENRVCKVCQQKKDAAIHRGARSLDPLDRAHSFVLRLPPGGWSVPLKQQVDMNWVIDQAVNVVYPALRQQAGKSQKEAARLSRDLILLSILYEVMAGHDLKGPLNSLAQTTPRADVNARTRLERTVRQLQKNLERLNRTGASRWEQVQARTVRSKLQEAEGKLAEFDKGLSQRTEEETSGDQEALVRTKWARGDLLELARMRLSMVESELLKGGRPLYSPEDKYQTFMTYNPVLFEMTRLHFSLRESSTFGQVLSRPVVVEHVDAVGRYGHALKVTQESSIGAESIEQIKANIITLLDPGASVDPQFSMRSKSLDESQASDPEQMTHLYAPFLLSWPLGATWAEAYNGANYWIQYPLDYIRGLKHGWAEQADQPSEYRLGEGFNKAITHTRHERRIGLPAVRKMKSDDLKSVTKGTTVEGGGRRRPERTPPFLFDRSTAPKSLTAAAREGRDITIQTTGDTLLTGSVPSASSVRLGLTDAEAVMGEKLSAVRAAIDKLSAELAKKKGSAP
jgi:hypothetical protein